MSGSRQLFGVDFPTTNMLGSDVVTILSCNPRQFPGRHRGFLAVRVTLSDGNQIDRHIFLDLTSGSYGNVIETVLGEGNASNVVAKAVDVIWGDAQIPGLGLLRRSYGPYLCDRVLGSGNTSSWGWSTARTLSLVI